jgi:hypothetical protein
VNSHIIEIPFMKVHEYEFVAFQLISSLHFLTPFCYSRTLFSILLTSKVLDLSFERGLMLLQAKTLIYNFTKGRKPNSTLNLPKFTRYHT